MNARFLKVVWMDYGWIMDLAMSDGLYQVLDGTYSDVAFKVGNTTIKAQKVVVSRCKYFDAMLDGNNVESDTGIT